MTSAEVAEALRLCVITTMQIAGPLLLAMLVSGLATAVLQAVTQINEATLVFIPKAMTLSLLLLIMGHRFVDALRSYTSFILDRAFSGAS